MYRIADVVVVDPRDGSTTAHQDVWLADGRITEITTTTVPATGPDPGPDPGADPGPGAGRQEPPTIAGRGRFVVPGFVDMHAHPLNLRDPAPELRLMLAFGITGYRQMSGTPELLRQRRSHPGIVDDRQPRPLAIPGSVLTPINAGKPETAIAQVRRQASSGADFIKAGIISPEVYFAVQEEANRMAIPVVGHLPAGIDVRAASEAGFRSIEHLGPVLGVLAGCSRNEEHLLATPPSARIKAPPFRIPFADRVAEAAIRKIVINPAQLTSPSGLRSIQDAIGGFDEAKARDLARWFAANGTWNCPTLIRIKAQQLCDNPAFVADPDLRYVTAAERKAWSSAAAAFRRKFDEAQRAIFAEQWALQLRMVKILDEEGAPLLAGTDAVGAAWVIPGASLHDEFDLLAEAGLSPLRILQTTTIDAARFLHREQDAGTVEVGKEADLVLLDGDPTATVHNLHRVSGVVRSGRHHGTEALALLKEQLTNR